MNLRNPKFNSVWRRQGYALIPWSAEARDVLLGWGEGGERVGDIRVAQNPKYLAMYWTLCTTVADGVGLTPDDLSDRLKKRFGITSLSPQNMDAVAFNAFMRRAIVTMAEMIGAAPKDVLNAWSDACRRTP